MNRVFLGTAPPRPAMDKDPAHLSEAFRPKLLSLIEAMKLRGYRSGMIEGLRTVALQKWFYGWGRIWGWEGEYKTFRDGERLEAHMTGDAAHLWPARVDGRIYKIPDAHPFWNILGDEAERLGLTWGGRWKSIVDLNHVELAKPKRG